MLIQVWFVGRNVGNFLPWFTSCLVKFKWINQTWTAIAHHANNLKTVTNFRCEPSSKNVSKVHIKTSVATPYPVYEQMQTFPFNHYDQNMGNFQVQLNIYELVFSHWELIMWSRNLLWQHPWFHFWAVARENFVRFSDVTDIVLLLYFSKAWVSM